MSLGGGFNKSKSEQSSESGGPLYSISGGARGQAQNQLMNLLFGRGPGRTSGEGFGEGGTLGTLFSRAQTPIDYQAPDLMTPVRSGVQSAFDQAVRQGVGQFSANYANRGLNRPENLAAIVGGAAQNVAPQFADLYANTAAQQAQAQSQAPLVREDVTRKRFADLLAALGINVSALGDQSKSSGTGSSFGMNASGSASPVSSAPKTGSG